MKSPPTFKDHFSGQAVAYEKYRPHYPRELFAWLAANSPYRELAIDVATGNGQAAQALAEFFNEVVATDASAAQLANAAPKPRVRYLCEPAERISLPDSSVDLVVSSQAAHWFDWPAFAAEARRVLRPGGMLAIWSYRDFVVQADIERLLHDFSREVVGPYWPRERRHVEECYRSLALPFAECAAPSFEMRAEWDCESVLGYIGTWSAVQRCRKRSGRDPIALLSPMLRKTWGKGTQTVRWPLTLTVCHRQ